MKKVLISINPKWCEKILSGEKTIEVRKSSPGKVPFKCYIYCTKNGEELFVESDKRLAPSKLQKGKVIGEFICDEINEIIPDYQFGYENYLALCDTCLSIKEIQDYGKGKILDGWHISDLKIYDKPRELSEFISPLKQKNCVGYCRNGICSNLDYEELCGAIKRCEYKKISRPPQSWCYVEEL